MTKKIDKLREEHIGKKVRWSNWPIEWYFIVQSFPETNKVRGTTYSGENACCWPNDIWDVKDESGNGYCWEWAEEPPQEKPVVLLDAPKDISSEDWREYEYADGKVYRIEAPVSLHLREGGTGHRVVDKAGVTHWVPVNVWHVIRWKSEPKVSF